MWWPAIAGVVIGIGGIVCPEALGVGCEGAARRAHAARRDDSADRREASRRSRRGFHITREYAIDPLEVCS
jgi:hypothetical protein